MAPSIGSIYSKSIPITFPIGLFESFVMKLISYYKNLFKDYYLQFVHILVSNYQAMSHNQLLCDQV